MRKTSFITIGTFLLLATLFVSCVKVDDVEIKKIHGIEFKSMKDNVISFDIDASIYNPNSIQITIKEISLDVSTKKLELGNIYTTDRIKLPANSETRQTFHLKTEIKDLFGTGLRLMNVLKSKNLNVHLKGHVKAKALMVSKKIKIDQVEKISL